jgi:4-amino-4-deoxy-L-arabinose transferase-like glycosyltransferase
MDFLRKYQSVIIQVVLLFVATTLLCININRPLVDYDEATYAKVVVDTIKTGDISTFKLFGRDWFEKPPLYLWMVIGLVKVLGTSEFVFRIPSILFSVLSVWLVYLLVRELTKNNLAALSASSVLLFSPAFFVFAREARLDSGVIFSILFALWCYIKSWENCKFLFWFLPAVAVGFLFKSVIVFLIVPILFIYSLFYKKWNWIKNKYLWFGSILAMIIFLPWHIIQYIRFGNIFWNEYLVHQVFARAVTTLTGSNDKYDYIRILWLHYNPWIWVLFALFVAMVVISFKKELKSRFLWKQAFAPSFSAIFIVVLFTLTRTHLSTYIMPAFPFFAMFIALSGYNFYLISNQQYRHILLIGLIVCLSLAPFNYLKSVKEVVSPLHYEEKEVGQIYSNQNNITVPFYTLGWPFLETISYYSGIHAEYIDPNTASGILIKGPFYLATNARAVGFFYRDRDNAIAGYENLKILYLGESIVLFYSDMDQKLPKLIP